MKKYCLKAESQPESMIFKEKVRSAVEPQKKRDLVKKNTLPIRHNNTPFSTVKNDYLSPLPNFKNPGSPKSSTKEKMKEKIEICDEKVMSSPYFSKNLHAEEQTKVLQNLKTKEKSKQYTTRIMKSKKCDIDTLEYVLKGKYTLNHRANMDEYIKKVGLKENTKV